MKKVMSLNKLIGKPISNYNSVSANYTKLMRTEEPVTIGISQGELSAIMTPRLPKLSSLWKEKAG